MNSTKEKNMTEKFIALPRVLWVDMIRVLSTIMVIGIHFYGPYRTPGHEVSVFNYLFTNFIDFSFHNAVPFFVMISGYLLLSKKELFDSTFPSRVLRIIVPTFVWGIIYLIVWANTTGVNQLGLHINFYTGIKCLIKGDAAVHLWYLYMLFGLYLAAPILHVFVHNATPQLQKYFIVLWVFTSCVFPLLVLLLGHIFDFKETRFQFFIATSFVGMFVGGYYFGKMPISRKLFVCVCVTLIIGVVVACGIGLYADDRVKNICKPIDVPLMIAIFIAMKYIGSSSFYTHSIFSKWCTKLAPLTFGIYLVHILVRDFFVTSDVLGFTVWVGSLSSIIPASTLLTIPMGITLIFVISALIIYLLQNIPVVRWIVPK